jgi:hypothetical protein
MEPSIPFRFLAMTLIEIFPTVSAAVIAIAHGAEIAFLAAEGNAFAFTVRATDTGRAFDFGAVKS